MKQHLDDTCVRKPIKHVTRLHVYYVMLVYYVRCHPCVSLQHETASVQMFDHLVKENNLRPAMKGYGLSPIDLDFIKEQIAGPLDSTDSQDTVELLFCFVLNFHFLYMLKLILKSLLPLAAVQRQT